MPASPGTPRSSARDDQIRAASLLLACLDENKAETVRILDDANRAPGGLQGLLAALAASTIELLIGTVGEDGARKTLNMTLLDVSMHEGTDDDRSE